MYWGLLKQIRVILKLLLKRLLSVCPLFESLCHVIPALAVKLASDIKTMPSFFKIAVGKLLGSV